MTNVAMMFEAIKMASWLCSISVSEVIAVLYAWAN